MRKSTKTIAFLTLGLTTLVGSAFTASNTFAPGVANPVAGYASTEVTGGTVSTLGFELSPSGDSIDYIHLRLEGDTTSSNVSMSLNDGAAFSCGALPFFDGSQTEYFCTPAELMMTADLNKTAVIIS